MNPYKKPKGRRRQEPSDPRIMGYMFPCKKSYVEQAAVIEEYLELLHDQQQRDVLRLRYLDNTSQGDVAKQFGIPKKSVAEIEALALDNLFVALENL